MNTTGVGQIFLATLDESLSAEAIGLMNESNIHLVTTRAVKSKCYRNLSSVLDLEELMLLLQKSCKKYSVSKYPQAEKDEITNLLQKQAQKYAEIDFVGSYFVEQLALLR